MTTETNPVQPEVSQEQSIDDKLSAKFGLGDEPAEVPQPEEPEAQAQPEDTGDELTGDDLPEEAPDAPTAEELELTHNGQKVRVPKDEAVKLAQMGYDYTQKTQALARERQEVEQIKAAVAAKMQLTPQLIQAAAKVEAINSQLQQYAAVDWVQLAQNDPLEYPKYQATYMKLQEAMQGARAEFGKVFDSVQQVDSALSQQDMQKAWEKTFELMPHWRDEGNRSAEQKRILSYLQSEGYAERELATVSDPRAIVIARKAMLYDEAMKAKSSRQNQLKPAPSVRPGAAPPMKTEAVRRQEALKTMRQAKDPDRKSAALDEVLALKFGLK